MGTICLRREGHGIDIGWQIISKPGLFSEEVPANMHRVLRPCICVVRYCPRDSDSRQHVAAIAERYPFIQERGDRLPVYTCDANSRRRFFVVYGWCNDLTVSQMS